MKIKSTNTKKRIKLKKVKTMKKLKERKTLKELKKTLKELMKTKPIKENKEKVVKKSRNRSKKDTKNQNKLSVRHEEKKFSKFVKSYDGRNLSLKLKKVLQYLILKKLSISSRKKKFVNLLNASCGKKITVSDEDKNNLFDALKTEYFANNQECFTTNQNTLLNEHINSTDDENTCPNKPESTVEHDVISSVGTAATSKNKKRKLQRKLAKNNSNSGTSVASDKTMVKSNTKGGKKDEVKKTDFEPMETDTNSDNFVMVKKRKRGKNAKTTVA